MAATDADHEAVARQRRQHASDGAGAKVANLAVPPHAHGLQHVAGGGGRHDDARQSATSWAGLRPWCDAVSAARWPPLTSATPATISTMPAQRRVVMRLVQKHARPASATSTYPTAVTGST